MAVPDCQGMLSASSRPPLLPALLLQVGIGFEVWQAATSVDKENLHMLHTECMPSRPPRHPASSVTPTTTVYVLAL